MKLIKPMLAVLGSHDDLKRSGFIFEPKLDGIRALCYVEKRKLRFFSRNGYDLTSAYPEFDFIDAIDAETAILDGEIVMYNKKGIPDFHVLQMRGMPVMGMKSREAAFFVVFDILFKNGHWLTQLPLTERKKIMATTIHAQGALDVIASSSNGPKLWRTVMRYQLEGVMAKDAQSTYSPGIRVPSWIKIKTKRTIDCVILGYSQERRSVSALALGLWTGTEWQYIGKVGTGFSQAMIDLLYKKCSRIKRQTPVCPVPRLANMHWVRPILVCEVHYMETTAAGRLRIPSFFALRSDKMPKECTTDQL